MYRERPLHYITSYERTIEVAMMNTSSHKTQQAGKNWERRSIAGSEYHSGWLDPALECKWRWLRQTDLQGSPRTRDLKRRLSALVLCQQNCVRFSMLYMVWNQVKSESSLCSKPTGLRAYRPHCWSLALRMSNLKNMGEDGRICERLLISTWNPCGFGFASIAWCDSFWFRWYDKEFPFRYGRFNASMSK